MKLKMSFLTFTLLFSTASIVSMDVLETISKETCVLHRSILDYQKVQEQTPFMKEWATSTTYNLALINTMARKGQTELLPYAINGLVRLPDQTDPQLQAIDLSVLNYRNSTLELLKKYHSHLYMRAQAQAYVQELRDKLRAVGERPLSDYV